MDSAREKLVLAALKRWAERHPRADEPAIQFGSGSHPNGLSPREIVKEIEQGTDDGQFLLEMIDSAMEDLSPEEVLKGFGSADGLMALQAHAR